MEEQFEYGELVEVRDFDGQEWEERVCAGELPNCKVYWTMKEGEGKGTYDGHPVAWQQMRKIQKPEPTNKPEPIEFWVGRLQTQVMSLMDRLSKIEDELRIKSMNKPVKKQLK